MSVRDKRGNGVITAGTYGQEGECKSGQQGGALCGGNKLLTSLGSDPLQAGGGVELAATQCHPQGHFIKHPPTWEDRHLKGTVPSVCLCSTCRAVRLDIPRFSPCFSDCLLDLDLPLGHGPSLPSPLELSASSLIITLAEGVEQARKKTRHLSNGPRFSHFLRAGESAAAGGRNKGVLATANDWEMRADLKKQLKFPEEIAHTTLRPDIVLWSRGTKQVVLIELTEPWEERMEEAYERKLRKYQTLILESQQNGWKAWNLPVEVGCRGFAGRSLWRALGLLGIEGLARKRLVANTTKRAEEASRWIWIQRKVRWQSRPTEGLGT
nr:uncharacterized protein LOC133619721 [Nerophis lumbriciformis]